MQNFFFLISCNRIRFKTITRILEKKRNSSAFYWAICTQIASFLFIMTYTLWINYWAILSTITEISLSQKFSKSVTTCPPVEWFSLKIDRNQLYNSRNVKFHEILSISSDATLAITFLSHTQKYTDKQKDGQTGIFQK